MDLDGFNVELQKQKERARNATANEFGDWVEYAEGDPLFVGYDSTTVEGAKLLRHREVVQKNRKMLQLVFDRTPFYGEMGGEVGDTGYVEAAGERIKILDTVKENGLTVHIAEKLPEDCTADFKLVVDAARRQNIANNHSCTHLLDQALREILGTHVEQKGSFVSDTQLRFDFSHFEKLSDEQIRKVENRVNEMIRENYLLEEKRDATMEEAQAMGAIALFGEKYGDSVRVVKFGPSVELCGGCHVSATGRIGFFKIVSEGAIAAGVRRIEAVTGVNAEQFVASMQDTVKAARAAFNNAPDLVAAINKLVEDNAALKKQAEEFAKQKTAEFAKAISAGAKEANGVKLIVVDQKASEGINPAMLREAALLLQKGAENTAVVAAYVFEGKPQLALMYSADLVAKGKNAGADIREGAKFIQGGGGGQPGLATAGGKNPDGIKDALEALTAIATK